VLIRAAVADSARAQARTAAASTSSSDVIGNLQITTGTADDVRGVEPLEIAPVDKALRAYPGCPQARWTTGRRGPQADRVARVIVSVGIDVVLVDRFAKALERTPLLADRLFTDSERMTSSGNPRSAESLAARFAAKEAVAKALGAPAGLRWHDCEVVTDPDGRPWLTVSGTVAAVAAERGVSRWHLSLSHDGGIASAMVVAEA
jgi:holo-[acyl-carrier protein] synthase